MSLRILFVSPYLPSRQRVRTLGLVTGLARRGHRVAVVAADRARQIPADLAALCERVETVDIPPTRQCLNAARGVRAGLPAQAALFDDDVWRRRVEAAWRGGGYDILHVEHMRGAAATLGLSEAPRVFDAVDCLTDLLDATSEHAHPRLSRLWAAFDHRRTERYEARLMRSFDFVIATSAAEADGLARLPVVGLGPPIPAVRVVGNGVELDHFTPSAQRRETETVVFVGRLSYHANVTAAVWLLEHVMPRVWRHRPAARVVLCGADPSRTLRRLARRRAGRIEVTGTVADVRPYLWGSTVAVSPIRYGAGVQNKVLEAMATATPVVATPTSCAALDVRAGRELLVAETADDFAAQLLSIIDNPELGGELGRRGRQYVEARHDWRSSIVELEDVYAAALRAHGQTGGSA